MPIVLYAKLRSQIQTTGIILEHIQDMRMIVLLRHVMLLLLIRGELATTIIIIAHTRCFLVVYTTLGSDGARIWPPRPVLAPATQSHSDHFCIANWAWHSTSDVFLDRSKLEEAFANEISFHYFLSLNQDIFIPPLNAMEYYTEIETLLSEDRHNRFLSTEYDRYSLAPQPDHLIPIFPRRRLLDILDNSRVIRNALMNWINDCIIFHKQTGTVMDKLYNEIRGRYMIRLLNFS